MTNANVLAAVAARGFRRNRIQNGAMQIDQRYNGTGVAIATGGPFGDRWWGYKGGATNVVAGAVAVSVPDPANAPLPFALVYNVTTGTAPAAADYCGLGQAIEGSDMGDLRWGTAAAKPVTLSFSLYTPLAGLYAFRLANPANNRSYVGTFTVNAGSTWERKQVTIPGDTTGGWPVTAADKWNLAFDMGSGSNFNAPAAGVWGDGNLTRIAGTVNFAAAARAFYLTAVQLEVGTIATPFEWLPASDVQRACERWYEKGNHSYYVGIGGVSQYVMTAAFKTRKRAIPIITGIAADHAAINVTPTEFCLNRTTGAPSGIASNWIADCEGV